VSVYIPKNRGSYLGWLSRVDKTLPMPTLVYMSDLEVGGYYFHPNCSGLVLDDIEIENPNGTIVVNYSPTCDHDYYPERSVLAHEWRHHWQFFNRDFKNEKRPKFDFSRYDTYEAEMVRFFSSLPSEMDALRFEYKTVKGEHSRWVMSLLQKHKGMSLCQ
jgi:hypothetical protein